MAEILRIAGNSVDAPGALEAEVGLSYAVVDGTLEAVEGNEGFEFRNGTSFLPTGASLMANGSVELTGKYEGVLTSASVTAIQDSHALTLTSPNTALPQGTISVWERLTIFENTLPTV